VQSDYAWPTLIFTLLAALSIAADWWRHRRREADRAAGRAGLVPWPLITILAMIAAAMCAGLWLRGQ
jgi:hypothetical protein